MKRYYAQNGEDKFLESQLPKGGWFVDVGAWNGRYLSNTYFLIENGALGWNGLEIEADPNRVLEMKKHLPDRIYRIAKIVGENDLDELISMFPDIPKDFDLLSIDIDSYDYHVWKNLVIYQPKFVIIEVGSATNPQEMNELADKKGYGLIWDKANFIYKRL